MINLPLQEDIQKIKSIPGVIACVYSEHCVCLLTNEIHDIDFTKLICIEDELDLNCSIRALQGKSVEEKFGYMERLF
jgi:hypothetical protein